MEIDVEEEWLGWDIFGAGNGAYILYAWWIKLYLLSFLFRVLTTIHDMLEHASINSHSLLRGDGDAEVLASLSEWGVWLS